MATVRSWALSVLFLALPVAPACKSPPAAQPANVDRCTSEPVLSRDLATPGNTLILGETHGTREVLIFAADLACHALAQGRTLVLALEIPASEQVRIDRFLASSGDAAARADLVPASSGPSPCRTGDGAKRPSICSCERKPGSATRLRSRSWRSTRKYPRGA